MKYLILLACLAPFAAFAQSEQAPARESPPDTACDVVVANELLSGMLDLQYNLAVSAQMAQEDGRDDLARTCAARAMEAGERGLAGATVAYVESLEAAAAIADAQGQPQVAITANRKAIAALRLGYEAPQIPTPVTAQEAAPRTAVYDAVLARLAMALADRLTQAKDPDALAARAGLAALANCNLLLAPAREDFEAARDALAESLGAAVPKDVPACPGPAYFLVAR